MLIYYQFATSGTYFNEILIKIQILSFTKLHLKMLFAKCQPFCLGLNELISWNYMHLKMLSFKCQPFHLSLNELISGCMPSQNTCMFTSGTCLRYHILYNIHHCQLVSSCHRPTHPPIYPSPHPHPHTCTHLPRPWWYPTVMRKLRHLICNFLSKVLVQKSSALHLYHFREDIMMG